MRAFIFVVIIFVIIGCVSTMSYEDEKTEERQPLTNEERQPLTNEEKQQFRCLYCDLLSERPKWCGQCN